MNKRTFALAAGIGTLSLALIALPSPSANSQEQNDSSVAGLQQRLEALQERLQAKLTAQQDDKSAQLAEALALQASLRNLAQQQGEMKRLEIAPEAQAFTIVSGDEGASWLGVETHEVTADKAKELKLPAEHGVVVGKVITDSPASKAGLKENDVVTEINGQRIEGAMQFRRMIREIPAGRSVQLTVWRDGHSQTLSATLGKSEEGRGMRMQAAPGTFSFRTPEMSELNELPQMDWEGVFAPKGQPRLGIDAEDLNGQFGNYFGAPEGEGILVRDVNTGSPAEKAGLKAGDVITSVNGDRIRSVGDLREKLAPKSDDKDRSIKLGVLRNKSSMTLTVELPAPALRQKRVVKHRTNI
jgi:C-terminal processing protease CtpA/Prc